MPDLTPLEDEDDEIEYQPPAHSTPGRILVRVLGRVDTTYRYETEVLDSDTDTGVFWISEGMGFDYWFDQYIDKFPADEGTFVIEGVKGEYVRGEWGVTDDDEEWEYASIREATPEEIRTECLGETT